MCNTTAPCESARPTIAVRDGRPAVNVKDRNLWARDPRTVAAITELGEARTQSIYEDVQTDFWNIAEGTARESYGYRIYQDGRSGGWLVVSDGVTFLEYLDSDNPWTDDGGVDRDDEDGYADTYVTAALHDRDKFLRFADEMGALKVACATTFVENVTEALADLERRREDNAIRSEN